MSEEEIIKELDKVINNNKDRTFMTGELNYVAMAESCKVKILDLQNQLQQKENIIKEAREIVNTIQFEVRSNDKKYSNLYITLKSILQGQELLEILDKEVN